MASPIDVSACPRPVGSPVRVEVLDGVAAAERIWRALEGVGVATPYQRFDWVAAFAEAVPGRYRVVVVRDRAGDAVMLLPLALHRRFGVTVASAIGGKHANFVAPVTAPGWSRRIGARPALLAAIGRAVGADVLSFEGVPLTVSGVDNPLAAGERPSPNDAYGLPLGPTAEASLARGLSGPARKKLRAKERHLAELGAVALLGPVPDADLDRVLDAFYRQKERRFVRLGIANPFCDSAVRRFVRTAAAVGPGSGRAAVEVYALTLDGRVVAVLGGAVDERRFSGMFVSFDGDDETLLRCSPGEILLGRVIARATERGFLHLDLGVGDAFYKRLFCSEIETLRSVLVPIGWRGRAWAAAAAAGLAAKRRLKRSPAAMRLVRTLRRSGHGSGGTGEP